MSNVKNISLQGWRDKLLVSFEEAGVILSESSRTVYRLVAAGELPQPVKVRHSSRLLVQDLITYVDRLTKTRDTQSGDMK